MMGPESAEMIHTAVMAMKMGATAGEFQRILFGHPTLSEAMLGSVDDARKGAVDLPKRS
jgi:pyruvate/2-oxoglutarate dehydrogenase complex dihydrolipoamide dehydrogenase (E3) component